MKKLLLIITILLITGCYDYTELNDLAFISAIGIDHQDEQFILTYEILSDEKKDDNNTSSYIVTSTGSTLSKAVDNISLKISKIPYYYHIKVVIIDNETAQNHMNEVTDFLIRDPKILNGFYLVTAKDTSSNKILSLNSKNIIADEINEMIRSNKEEFNTIYNGLFEDFLEDYLNEFKEASLTSISIVNNKLSVSGLALFRKHKLSLYLNNEDSAILNMLKNEKSNTTLENENMAIKLSSCKSNYEINKTDSNISISCDGQITKNTKYNLKDEAEYKKLNDIFSNLLKEKVESLITLLKENKIDAFNLKYHQYQKYKISETPKINNINAKVNINKKGLIFGVNNG